MGMCVSACAFFILRLGRSPRRRRTTTIRAGREMNTAAAVRAVSAVVATPGRHRHRVHSRAVRASASTMSAPVKVSEAAEQAPAIPPPAHPTYSIADAIRLALEEDIADVGDISSLSTCVSFESRATWETISSVDRQIRPRRCRLERRLAERRLTLLRPGPLPQHPRVHGERGDAPGQGGRRPRRPGFGQPDPRRCGRRPRSVVEQARRRLDRKGGRLLRDRGKAHSILRAERVVLNFMQRMSGIATLTKAMADQAAPAYMLETRKTVPGLRSPISGRCSSVAGRTTAWASST